MGGGNRLLGNFPSMAASNLLDFIKYGVADLPYIVNLWDHVESTGWVSSCANISNGNPGSTHFTGSWGGRFTHSTLNWSGSCDGSVNGSPADSPRSPISPCASQRCIFKISFAEGISSVRGAGIIAEILGFVVGGKTETSPVFRQQNNFSSKIYLLV